MMLSRVLKQPVLAAMIVTAVWAGATVSFAADTNSAQAPSWNEAKNLARVNCGAHIDRILPGGQIVPVNATEENENPAALVLDDNTLSVPVSTGDNTFIVTLPGIATMQRFSFINQGSAAQGDFDVAVSNYRLGSQDPKWHAVQQPASFSGQRLVNLPLAGVEAKYVRIVLHVRKEGRIAGIALYGNRTLEGFASRHVLQAQSDYTFAATGAKPVARPETLSFNFANRYANGRVAYVSSGDPGASPRLIDDDVATSYTFAASDEHPTLIVELAQRQDLYRVSAVFDPDEGQVDIYLLNALPVNADLRGCQPIASLVDDKATGKASANFEPTNARYVVFRWSHAKAKHKPFGVAEIATFSMLPLNIVDLEQSPTFANNARPGEGGTDFSNSLGTIADPPAPTPVSP